MNKKRREMAWPVKLKPPPKKIDTEKILNNISISKSGCWNWVGPKSTEGYGIYREIVMIGTYSYHKAHRVVYALFKGKPKHTIDHLCRNKICVNPDHLEDVDIFTNIMRGKSRYILSHLSGICLKGHKLGLPDKDGRHDCRICRKKRQEGYRLKRRLGRTGGHCVP